MALNFEGLILGACAFLCIGMFHPLVIKSYYYCGINIWWAFLLGGIAAVVGSLFVSNDYLSVFLGIFAFSAFWGIGEIFRQRERVRKGWFPANPKRKEQTEK